MRGLLLITVLLISCGDVRPLPSADVRLARRPVVDRPSPSPAEPRAARRFLLPAPMATIDQDGRVHLRALPAGDLEPAILEWQASGGDLQVDGATAVLTPTGPWEVTVSLRRGATVLATATARAPEQPPPARRARRRARLSLDVASCADSAFPRQVGDGHIGCTEPGRLDLWVAPGASSTAPIEAPPIGSAHRPKALRADGAGSSAGSDRLVVAAERLILWGPGDAGANRPLSAAEVIGRPATHADQFAFARTDRVEVGERDSSARSQLAARPADVDAPVALAGPWVAVVEGEPGHERLRLHQRELRTDEVLVGDGAPRTPVLSLRYLAWLSPAGAHVLDLEQGWRRDVPLQPASGPPALLGHELVVAERGGGVAVVHLPTGDVQRIATDGRLTELRGGFGDRFTVWEHAPGDPGHLVQWSLR